MLDQRNEWMRKFGIKKNQLYWLFSEFTALVMIGRNSRIES